MQSREAAEVRQTMAERLRGDDDKMIPDYPVKPLSDGAGWQDTSYMGRTWSLIQKQSLKADAVDSGCNGRTAHRS